jgi:ergothioneine biosynthesis protein EgtB
VEREALRSRYLGARRATEALCRPLTVEDCVVQAMPDASPVRWHLAHTSWFFEHLVLRPLAAYRPLDARYAFLFNSYYESLGERHPRPERGLLSRPTVSEVMAYRRHVDDAMERHWPLVPSELVELGIHHEEQHQELILTDVKLVLALNPLEPVYQRAPERASTAPAPLAFTRFEGGVVSVGDAGPGFAFDNERPRHRVFLQPFALARRLVTCGEFRQFMDDGGYVRPLLWLSDGWDAIRRWGWQAPLYWVGDGDGWRIRTLSGARAIDPAEPVCHVSYYEADAYARWAGARLPSESEWEHAAAAAPVRGNFLDSGELHPRPAQPAQPVDQLFGDVWEWTASAYLPYPGYAAPVGALGEYNGKFMSNRMVLRGGSCATWSHHVRASYRNFFAPEARWQFSGFRLAR